MAPTPRLPSAAPSPAVASSAPALVLIEYAESTLARRPGGQARCSRAWASGARISRNSQPERQPAQQVTGPVGSDRSVRRDHGPRFYTYLYKGLLKSASVAL